MDYPFASVGRGPASDVIKRLAQKYRCMFSMSSCEMKVGYQLVVAGFNMAFVRYIFRKCMRFCTIQTHVGMILMWFDVHKMSLSEGVTDSWGDFDTFWSTWKYHFFYGKSILKICTPETLITLVRVIFEWCLLLMAIESCYIQYDIKIHIRMTLG